VGFCTACGAGLAPEQRFCAQCGAARQAVPTQQAPSPPAPSPQAESSQAEAPQGQPPQREPSTSPLSPVAGPHAHAAGPAWAPAAPPAAPASRAGSPWRWPALLSVLVLVGVAGVTVGWWLSGDDTSTAPTGQAESGTEGGASVGEGSGDAGAGVPSGESGTVALPQAPPDWDRDRVAVAEVQTPGQSADSQDNAGNPVTYDATNMTDGAADTAWRMDGDGTGQELTVALAGPTTVTHVGLVNGYAKTDTSGDRDDRYRQNRRITSVTWTLDDGTTVTQSLAQTRALQYVAVPDAPATSSVRLTINSTTAPGSKDGRVYDHTAVSELAVFGQ
jgi:hypothetical protein